MEFYSPLRYPGGKNKLAKFIALVCEKNHINGHYVEPYAGGASVALHLLIKGYVNEITINDLDKSIHAFWYSVLERTDEFCKRIDEAQITVENWKKQRKIQENKEQADVLDLGFSTFFMNRTNRSGIINGGIIGGTNQEGLYKIDCRFNKKELIKRIRLIADYKEKIHLYSLDALDLIEKVEIENKGKNVIFYFDPPYFLKGQSLYMNSYEPDNHKEVSERIQKIRNAKWIVSYDNVPQIRVLYKNKAIQKKRYSFFHTAYSPRIGKEILFFSKGLLVPVVSRPVGL